MPLKQHAPKGKHRPQHQFRMEKTLYQKLVVMPAKRNGTDYTEHITHALHLALLEQELGICLEKTFKEKLQEANGEAAD